MIGTDKNRSRLKTVNLIAHPGKNRKLNSRDKRVIAERDRRTDTDPVDIHGIRSRRNARTDGQREKLIIILLRRLDLRFLSLKCANGKQTGDRCENKELFHRSFFPQAEHNRIPHN